jgi:hypothetical protein
MKLVHKGNMYAEMVEIYLITIACA